MKIEKKVLGSIKRCYSVTPMQLDDQEYLMYASEDPGVGCYMFSGDNYETKTQVWEEAGGCMSIQAMPGRKNEILAIQEFYLKINPSLSKIVHGRYTEAGWEFKDLVVLPYLHRFGLIESGEDTYLLCCTIAKDKKNKEDWSLPGQVYAGKLPKNLDDPIELEVILDGVFKNHGIEVINSGEASIAYIGTENGLFTLRPPKEDNTWQIEQILDNPISDIAVLDLDGDGVDEIVSIEPFHGNQVKVYKSIDGKYQPVFTYENKIDFTHGIYAAKLRGKNTFFIGVRREDAELFYIQYNNGQYESHIIDKGAGPANICVINHEDQDLIMAANHTANEAALYIVRD